MHKIRKNDLASSQKIKKRMYDCVTMCFFFGCHLFNSELDDRRLSEILLKHQTIFFSLKLFMSILPTVVNCIH